MLLGVDVGGTFTDAVVFDGRELHTAKAPTTPDDQSEGVLAAVASALERAGAKPADVKRFAHGMTVGTNALLEERGARTALVTTAGFEDLLEIGRQARPSLYRLCAAPPHSLIGDGLRFGAHERGGPNGTVESLAEGEAERLAEAIAETGAESVAICLLFAYVDAGHERELAAALRERLADTHVSVSHEVLPRFREYERCSTTVIDAYLSPLLGRYLSKLATAADGEGLAEPEVMRSSGGVVSWSEAAEAGAWSVLSGPAGGAVGAGLVAELSGGGNALGLDMGGTSCDVCVVEGGRVRLTDSREIGGRVIQLPMVDVHTVGAGGGSIASRDEGGALRVGPRSAGAEPGPAAYGRGGTEPTVTDANVVLGRLAAGSELAGGVSLDGDAAERAVATLAGELGLETVAAAAGIVRLANQEMVRALRVVTIERGLDPRPFALLPFGGAGPAHAAAIAEELGITRILCPRAGGVLSAVGLLASDRRRDGSKTVMLSGGELTAERVASEVDALSSRLAEGMDGAEIECTYELRYRGQGFELPVRAGPAPRPDELEEEFAAEHERRYGFRDSDAGIELVHITVAAVVPGPRPEPRAAAAEPEHEQRQVWIDGDWDEAAVLRGELPAGTEIAGPAVLELPETTMLVPAGWSARVDEHGTIEARRAE